MSKFQKLKDYSTEIGKKYNHLTITGLTKKPDLRKGCNITYAICECELCGNKNYEGILSVIKAGKIKSCCGRDYQTKRLSEIGKKYNRLIIKDVYLKEILASKSTGKKTTKAFALCDCDCGTQNFEAQLQSIKDGRTSSCGCLIHDINGATYKDLTGQKFGFWTVIKDTGKRYINGNIIWLCECSCKNKTRKEVDSGTLISGESTSCGCLMTNSTNLSVWKSKLSGNLNKNNTTGVNGVWYSIKLKKYVAEIKFQKHKIHLGVFSTLGEAYIARKEANEKYVLPLMEKKFSVEEIKQMIKAERHQRAIPKKVNYSDSHGINTLDIQISKDLNSIYEKYTTNETNQKFNTSKNTELI